MAWCWLVPPVRTPLIHADADAMKTKQSTRFIAGGGKTAARNILQRALVLLPTIHIEDVLDEDSGKVVPKITVRYIPTEFVELTEFC